MLTNSTVTCYNNCSAEPKFQYGDFHRNFLAAKVMETNPESRGHKPSRHVQMFATKFVTNPFVSI